MIEPIEPPASPLAAAGKRAVGAAALGFVGAAAAYLLANIGMDIDSATPGVQMDPYFWHKLVATGLSAAAGAGALWRWLGEGTYDEGRRNAVVHGDASKLSAADVGYPLVAGRRR